MNYHAFIFSVLLCFSCVFAQNIEKTLADLELLFPSKRIEVIKAIKGTFGKRPLVHTFSLETDHDYRFFILVDQKPTDLKPRLILADERSDLPPKEFFEQIPCTNWFVSIFRRSKATVVVSQINGGTNKNYVLILTTGGAQTEPGQNTKKVVSSRGETYEIQNGRVFRDGKVFFDKRNKGHNIVSLTIAQNDDLFLLSERGDVFRRQFFLYQVKGSRLPIVRVVTSNENNVFLFRVDGVVLKNGNRTVFKGTKDKRAIDLVEQNGAVWVIRNDGRRIFLK